MEVPEFFELFIRELKINRNLQGYYRLLDNPRRFLWRKAYLEQRLAFVHEHLGSQPMTIWDVGCGYGTTAIFTALNGHRVKGSTLEFYYDQIQRRLDYWSSYGDLSGMTIVYENLFDSSVERQSADIIIVQDTLHHLEPIDQACSIFLKALKPGGKMIVSEENGSNPFILGKNFVRRGFNRVGEIFDERLGKMIPFGNENARSLKKWKKILEEAGFSVVDDVTRFIRLFPPFSYNEGNYRKLIDRENDLGQKSRLLSNYLFFGINFIALSAVALKKS
jgi:SAM-dependent methyltransferase